MSAPEKSGSTTSSLISEISTFGDPDSFVPEEEQPVSPAESAAVRSSAPNNTCFFISGNPLIVNWFVGESTLTIPQFAPMVLTAANAAIVVQFAVRQNHASLLLTHLSLTISYPCVLFVNLILISSEIAPRLPSDLICRRCVP